MGKNTFAAKHFHDEESAREWFEQTRWPSGPNCPTCGTLEPYQTKKAGVYRCKAKECRRDFTVTTGTVMERSHAKLTLWAAAFHMAASSKKGFSAHQLHRTLGCQYNTAWFMFHRVREAMRRGGFDLPPVGGAGKIIEMDETYYGKPANPRKVTVHGTEYKFKKRRNLKAFRTLEKMPTQRPRNRRTSLPLIIDRGTDAERTLLLPSELHPTTLLALPKYLEYPGIFGGRDASEIKQLTALFAKRTGAEDATREQLGATSLSIQWDVDRVAFTRMLAKIAHGVMIASYGLNAATPFLTDIILRGELDTASYVIGGGEPLQSLPGKAHAISVSPYKTSSGTFVLGVSIRLFSQIEDTPTYLLMTGETEREPQIMTGDLQKHYSPDPRGSA